MGPSWRINPTIHRTMSERSYHGATSCSHKPNKDDHFNLCCAQLLVAHHTKNQFMSFHQVREIIYSFAHTNMFLLSHDLQFLCHLDLPLSIEFFHFSTSLFAVLLSQGIQCLASISQLSQFVLEALKVTYKLIHANQNGKLNTVFCNCTLLMFGIF